MKKILPLVAVIILIFSLAGCAENKTRVAEGAGIGTVLGAGLGAIMGYQSGHPLQGAAIGGAIGAAGGAAVGSQINKPGTATAPTTTTTTAAADQISMQQIIDWSKQGVSADEIVVRIRNTHSTYALTMSDIDSLKTNGVAQRVIDEMLAAR